MDNDVGEEILEACLGDVDCVYLLIERNRQYIDWQEPDNNISILHNVVYNDAREACRILLSAGAYPNCVNKVCNNVFINVHSFNKHLEWRNTSSLGGWNEPIRMRATAS